MISDTSKENFVKSKSSEEKVQNVRDIYDAILRIREILGMVWPNCAIIINLRNEIFSPGPVTWLGPGKFVTVSSMQCNFPGTEIMKFIKFSSKSAPCQKISR